MQLKQQYLYCEECGSPLVNEDKTCLKCQNAKFSFFKKLLGFVKESRKILISLILFFAAFWYLMFCWLPKTPEYSVYMTVFAIKYQDLSSFKKYVDVEKVSSFFVDKSAEYDSNSSWAKSFEEGLKEVLQPKFVDYMTGQIEHFVICPDFYKKELLNIDLPKVAEVLILKHTKAFDLSIKNLGKGDEKLLIIKDKIKKRDLTVKLSKDESSKQYMIIAVDSKILFKELKYNY